MRVVKAVLITTIQITGILSLFFITWDKLPISFIVFNLVYFFYGQFSFSMGWHRYFSHRSFETSKTMEWIFYLGGSSLFIGSMFEWLAEHKQHHAYLNESADPTNRRRGFLYSHLGWIVLFSIGIEKILKVIGQNKTHAFMYKLHYFCYFLFSWVVPIGISYLLFPELLQCVMVAGCVRLMVLHHTLGLLNSYCHKPTEPHTFNSVLASILCVGEGYQLNHHLFPQDYRYGLNRLSWDPTKWLIWFCAKIGIVSNLKINNKTNEKIAC